MRGTREKNNSLSTIGKLNALSKKGNSLQYEFPIEKTLHRSFGFSVGSGLPVSPDFVVDEGCFPVVQIKSAGCRITSYNVCYTKLLRVKIGDKEYLFSEKNNSNGCLDWSRAVFPYHVEWRWCTASGRVGGIPFGLNRITSYNVCYTKLLRIPKLSFMVSTP